MADNFIANAVDGSKTFRSEDIEGVQHSVTKLYTGVAGSSDGPVSNGNPLPVGRAKPWNLWSYTAASGGLVNTTGLEAKGVPGVGFTLFVGSIDIVNSHPTIGTEIVLRDGPGGAVIFRTWAAPNGGGMSKIFDPCIKLTENTALELAEITSTPSTGVYVNLTGWIG